MIDIKDITVFISYSSSEKHAADRVCAFLENSGKRCWIAPRDIAAGTEYGEEIINGIEQSDVMVLVFSKAANASQHVLREVERAVNKKMPVIAFKIEESTLTKSLEYFLLSNQWLDATENMEKMLEPLNRSIEKVYDLKNKAGENGVPSPKSTIHVTNRVVPIILGVIAVGVVAIAMAVALSSADTTPGISGNIRIGSSSSEDPEPPENSSEFSGDIPVTEPSEQGYASAPQFATGELFNFGRYYPKGYSEENNDSEIVWQILDINSENKTLRLVSEQIIDIKPFDCAESGIYNISSDGTTYDEGSTYTPEQLAEFHGSNDWYNSDLRAWLNASGEVIYAGIYPTNAATDKNGNSFENQTGFLTDFTLTEQDILGVSDYAAGDKVTLLSLEEIDDYSASDRFTLFPTVTSSAIASDITDWYKSITEQGNNDYFWATKTPSENNASDVVVVQIDGAHELYSTFPAAISGFGIRPVIVIDYSTVDYSRIKGDGSRQTPYSFDFTN